MTAQLSFAVYLDAAVWSASGDLGEDCNSTTTWLRWVALMAFVCMVVKDVVETWELYLWISMFPSCKTHAFSGEGPRLPAYRSKPKASDGRLGGSPGDLPICGNTHCDLGRSAVGAAPLAPGHCPWGASQVMSGTLSCRSPLGVSLTPGVCLRGLPSAHADSIR